MISELYEENLKKNAKTMLTMGLMQGSNDTIDFLHQLDERQSIINQADVHVKEKNQLEYNYEM